MSSEAQVALITGVFTLAGLVGGGWLGWILNGRTQFRDEKRAAFVEFLAAMDACQHDAVRMRSMLKIGSSIGERETDRMLDALDRVDTARTVVALILPDRTHPILVDAVNACSSEYERAMLLEP